MTKRDKNPGGKPPKYKDERELKSRIAEYFKRFSNRRKRGYVPPNKAGLCVFLGMTRETYSQYRNRYPDAIKEADMLIESAWIDRLSGQSATGAIFYMKNAFKVDYRDRYEHSSKVSLNPQPLLGGISKNHGELPNNDRDKKDSKAG